MHIIDTKKMNLRTDLLIDSQEIKNEIYTNNGVSLYRSKRNSYTFSTITFIDSTDSTQRKIIERLLTEELANYIEPNSKVLIVGLGNRKSTPDALGPKVLDNILVTRHLFLMGEVQGDYSNVAIFEPSVYGNTGISSVELIKHTVDIVKPDYTILIDSLCTSNESRLNKTIQLTDKGINPGSGVNNNRGELSKEILNSKVIAIGVPTVLDLESLILNILKKYNIDTYEIEDNLIVTPKEVDYLIEKLSFIISNSINNVLHPINRHN